MTADVEDNYVVAQANEPLDENGRFTNARVTCLAVMSSLLFLLKE